MTTRKGIEAPNYTAVPNRLFEIFPLMKEAELRVTLTIARETFGWRRDRKRLSLNLLMQLTGLSRQGVLNGTEFGIQRGTIERFEVKDYRNRKTFEYELLVLANDASCEAADRSTKLTGQLGRPVNLVDRNPALPVNEVDPLKEKTLKKKTTSEAPQPSQVSDNSFAADAAVATPPVLETETRTPPQPQVGQAQGAASGEAGRVEQASPVQDHPQTQVNGGPNRSTEVQDVPPAALAAGHWAMVDALRAAVYPGAAQVAPKLETRLGGAAKQLLAAGLGLDAPAGIMALIRANHAWRRSITPEAVVEHSGEWQSAQASMPRPGAEQPVPAPAAPALGCQPGERRVAPSGAVWTVEAVDYGLVYFVEPGAPADLLDTSVAKWGRA